MNAELVIYPQDDQLCCVLTEDGQPVEWLVDTDLQTSGLMTSGPQTLHRQDILLGRVRQVTPALSCVFVDIGLPHDAMLPLADAPVGIKAGQSIIVQIHRLTNADKGHQVTTVIELPGPFAVYIPQGSAKRRSKLRAFPSDVQQKLYQEDLSRLEKIWNSLLADSLQGQVPRCLLAAGDLVQTALISFISPDLKRILIEGDELFSRTYALVKDLMPAYLPLLALHVPGKGYGLAAVLGLTDLAVRVRQRKIWLDNGGFLVIDHTEALTVIDVNSGKDVKGRVNSDLRRRTNQIAAVEIARQLRLRNLGGNIVIDFLNLPDDAARSDLYAVMTAAMLRDRAKHRLLGFTALGLLEMTRTAL